MPRRLLLALLLAAAPIAADAAARAPRTPVEHKALDILRTVIALRTARGQGQVPAMAGYLAGRFRAAGFAAGDVHLLPMDSAGEPTAALVVRYRGDGSSGKRPIVLLAHMDVVDAVPGDWTHDPFKLIQEGGYFYGRGTLDDKSGVTALTATFLQMKEDGVTPDRDLFLAFTGDEETKQITARALAVRDDLKQAAFALNADAGGGELDSFGKPIAYNIQAAEKTYATFEITARSAGGHSSRPRLDNAIYDLTAALNRLRAFRFPVRYNDVTREFFRAQGVVTRGETGRAMRRFAKNPKDQNAADYLFGVPELVGATRTTCIPTMLRAGHAENALPKSAVATVNCRIFPGVAAEDVRARLVKVLADKQLQVKLLDQVFSSPASPLRADVMAALTKVVRARYPGLPVIPYMESGATDGVHFRAKGIPTYGVTGLFVRTEDTTGVHGRNEKLSVDAFYGSLAFWRALLGELAGG